MFFREIQIKRKLKRKRKQKRNGWGHLRGGASRPSRRFPRLRFWFRFRFNLCLIWSYLANNIDANFSLGKYFDANFSPRKYVDANFRPLKYFWRKNKVSQMIDLVMTIRTVQESSKSELSSRFLSTSKFLQFYAKWKTWKSWKSMRANESLKCWES